MRILHIIPSLGVGGTEKILLELCRGLDRNQFQCEVVALKDGGETIQRLRDAGIPVETLGTPSSIVSGLLDLPRLYLALRKKIQEKNPDIVHTWLTRANTLGRLAAKCAGAKHVISSLRVMEMEKYFHILAEKMTSPLCEVVTVNSTPLKNFALQEIGLPENKVKLIFNGITASSEPPKTARNVPDLVVGTMGRLHKQKGFDVFLRAVAQISPKYSRIKFLIAGAGPEENNLKTLAHDLHLSSVEFAGLAPSEKFLKSLDLFVLPSRWEGMPNVVMEAMNLGVPVACTAVGGAMDLIESGKEGILFEPEIPSACAEAVMKLISDPELRTKCAQAAQNKIKEKFSLSTMIKEHENLYGQILSGR